MKNLKSVILPVCIVVLILLFGFAVVQATRIIDPADLLPGLNAIEDASAQINLSGQRPLAQVAADLEVLRKTVESQTPDRPTSAQVAQRLATVSANLAAAEDDLNRDTVRLAAVRSEMRATAQILRTRIGSLPALGRLAGMSLKELLIAFAWPLVIGLIVLYLFGSQSASTRLKELFRPFKSVKLLGFEAVMGMGDELKQSAEDAFREYRNQTKSEFDRWEQRLRIRETVSRILESDVKPFLGTVPKGFRCTVHVPDILFENSLYQLIDYLPDGGGSGRAWSVRYGMMGKQWRLGASDASGEIPLDTDKLIMDWGMTRPEARDASRRQQSMVCAVLQPEDRDPVGIFYLDAEPLNAFGDPPKLKQLLEVIATASKKHGLLNDLVTMWDKVKLQAPLIRLDAPVAKRQTA